MLLPVRKKYPGGLRASLAAKKMKKEHQNFWWYSLPLCRRAGMFPDNRPQRAGRISPAPGFPRMRFFFLWLSVMLIPSTGHISCPDPAWRNACPVPGGWCCPLLCSLIPQNPEPVPGFRQALARCGEFRNYARGSCRELMGAARLPPPQRDRLMVHRVCIGAETGQ